MSGREHIKRRKVDFDKHQIDSSNEEIIQEVKLLVYAGHVC